MSQGRVSDPQYVFPAQPLYIAPDSTLFQRLDQDPKYVAEPKKNGWRCMVRVKPDGKIELWTRHRTFIKDLLPNLRRNLADLRLVPDSILDGELMEHRGEVKEQLVLWGAIRWGSKWLSNLPYQTVNRMVQEAVKESDYLKNAIQVFEAKRRFYDDVIAGKYGPGNEGIVLKNLEAPVAFGWRESVDHRQWFKVKPLVLADGCSWGKPKGDQ